MTSHTKTKCSPAPLPLESKRYLHKDLPTGLEVPVTRHTRGLLANETRHYSLENIRAMASASPADRVESLREHLRDRLERLGLPSDHTPRWIREADGQWRPYNRDRDGKIQIDRAQCLWIKRVEDLTEPLSPGRLAGALLFSVNQLLQLPGIEAQLWHICQVMEDYYSYQISGNINRLAMAGVASTRGRVAGHQALKARTAESRRVVFKHTQQHWDANPQYRGDSNNTAQSIVDAVNAELRQSPRAFRELRPKTIGDYIRAGIRENIFQTLPSASQSTDLESIAGAQ